MFGAKAKVWRQKLGRRGENAAARLLAGYGMEILVRNFRCRSGELDIVARDGDELHFIEVKSITARPGFTPAGNLSSRQRKRNFDAARFYCALVESSGYMIRFDLIEVRFSGTRVSSLDMTRDYLPPLIPPGHRKSGSFTVCT